jgi:hypothetical protein
MKLCHVGKDGGKNSTVWGFWPIEVKSLFSVALLVFEHGSRDAYHSHAFNSISWVLRGRLTEHFFDGETYHHGPSLRPIRTSREDFHKVVSEGRTIVLTFRGPWLRTWREFLPKENRHLTLTSGRKEVNSRG